MYLFIFYLAVRTTQIFAARKEIVPCTCIELAGIISLGSAMNFHCNRREGEEDLEEEAWDHLLMRRKLPRIHIPNKNQLHTPRKHMMSSTVHMMGASQVRFTREVWKRCVRLAEKNATSLETNIQLTKKLKIIKKHTHSRARQMDS